MRFIAFIILIFVSLFFAYFNHWQLFEQDAFWLARAGDEILKSHAVQTVDSWSFSVLGQEWINFQWLTSVVFSLVTKIGGQITALIWLRSLLSFVFFMICGGLILRSLQNKQTFLIEGQQNLTVENQQAIGILAIVLLAPTVYFTSWLRFQIRPDFFGMIFFAMLIYVINFNLFSKKIISNKYFAVVLSILVLWSNFHAGTVILGIFLISLTLLTYSKSNLKQKSIMILLLTVTWFATPQHWHVVKVLMAATQVYNNPDLQPFQLKNILYENSGFTYMVFWIYWFFCVGAYTFFTKVREKLSDLYQSKIFFYTMTAAFTFLFLQRQRTVPYITLCLLPVAAGYFSYFAEQSLQLSRISVRKLFNFDFLLKDMRWVHYKSWLFLFSGICGYWLVMLPIQKNINVDIGRKVFSQIMPVKSVEFIDYARPNLNLYNHFNFGGYIVYKLHDYPVFYDGRETPFLEVGQERDRAARDPKTFETFLKKYNINTVLESLPQGDMVKIYAEYYPPDEWARVYSDTASTVYVRRIPDHQYLISRYEKDGGKIQTEPSAKTSSESRPPKPSDQEIQKLLRNTQEQLKRNEK